MTSLKIIDTGKYPNTNKTDITRTMLTVNTMNIVNLFIKVRFNNNQYFVITETLTANRNTYIILVLKESKQQTNMY